MGNGLSLLFLRVTLIKLDGFDEQGAGEALGDRGLVAARALGAGDTSQVHALSLYHAFCSTRPRLFPKSVKRLNSSPFESCPEISEGQEGGVPNHGSAAHLGGAVNVSQLTADYYG